MARILSMRQALSEAFRQVMEEDERVIMLGEDIAGGKGSPGEQDAWGGDMGITKGLQPRFGEDRVLDTPISESAIKKMQKYSWPGNVRELQHAIERGVIMSSGHILNAEDLFFNPGNQDKSEESIVLEELTLEEVEKMLIRKALKKFDGNITLAAQELGLTRSSLYRRLEKYGL